MSFPKRRNLKEPSRQHLVIMGSRNPVKIKSTEEAFFLAFGKTFLVQGLNIESGVGKQPIGDSETFSGAYTRAANAKIAFPEADYWVGIEGGVGKTGDNTEAFAWIVIIDKSGKLGKAKTATFLLPKVILDLINNGMELGEAMDQVFNQENSKQAGGAVGILTRGALSRKEYYKQAVLLGLIPFMNQEMYK